jgi:hypothetical protein
MPKSTEVHHHLRFLVKEKGEREREKNKIKKEKKRSEAKQRKRRGMHPACSLNDVVVDLSCPF